MLKTFLIAVAGGTTAFFLNVAFALVWIKPVLRAFLQG